jgi:hypothetical protein
VSQIERASESQATNSNSDTISLSKGANSVKRIRSQWQRRCQYGKKKNGHRFNDNVNDSTQTNATSKWAPTVQGPEYLLEGDPSLDHQRPVHKSAPPDRGS